MVCIGLCIRGLGPLLSSNQESKPINEEEKERLYIGLASLVFASLAYSLLGVIYQTLVSTGDNPPSHSDIMLQSSLIGKLLTPCMSVLLFTWYMSMHPSGNKSPSMSINSTARYCVAKSYASSHEHMPHALIYQTSTKITVC